MLQQRHNAAASRKAAGRRDEGLSQRGRRRAGCRSAWKRHDYERHSPGERHREGFSKTCAEGLQRTHSAHVLCVS